MAAKLSWRRQLRRIIGPLFAAGVRGHTIAFLGVIFVLAFTLNGLNVVNSFVGRNFMTALANREEYAFYSLALDYLAVFFFSTLVAVMFQFCQDRLALFWRQRLMQHFLAEYLDQQAYYHLLTRKEIDNPDQRLSEDVRSFSTSLLSLVLIILNASITVVAFAVILWSIDAWLFGIAVAYALVGLLITYLLGARLVGLDFFLLAKEADLRYGLVRIREYGEAIALLHGEPEESEQVHGRLARVVEVIRQIIAVNRNMGFFTSFFNYLVPIVPIIVVAPAYIRGEIEFGQVTQAAMAFAQFLGGLAVFIPQFQTISAFAAVVARLGTLDQTMHEAQSPDAGQIQYQTDDARVAYDHVTLKTPGEDKILIRELSLEVPSGRHLLIRGHDGAGKSALFRATAGLWHSGRGTIVRPHRDQMMFLPQKPYTVFGTLRNQVLYGLHDRGISEDQLHEVLESLDLDLLVQRIGGLEAERDWPATLSVGEQQLLAFARLLLAKPSFAFLDQAINSLDPARGRRIYQLLAATSITYLSISDDSQLETFHDAVLQLADDGSWTTRIM